MAASVLTLLGTGLEAFRYDVIKSRGWYSQELRHYTEQGRLTDGKKEPVSTIFKENIVVSSSHTCSSVELHIAKKELKYFAAILHNSLLAHDREIELKLKESPEFCLTSNPEYRYIIRELLQSITSAQYSFSIHSVLSVGGPAKKVTTNNGWTTHFQHVPAISKKPIYWANPHKNNVYVDGDSDEGFTPIAFLIEK